MRYHNITKDDMLNGDGLRVVLWVAGCSHCCEGCQNPSTWDANGGIPFDDDAKEELFCELRKPYISGVTFSGGDPMFCNNYQDIKALAAEIKEKFPNKNIWMYTGEVWENLYEDPIIKLIDVLVDGEFHIEERDALLLWKGSANQRVIDVAATLASEAPEVPVLYCDDYY